MEKGVFKNVLEVKRVSRKCFNIFINVIYFRLTIRNYIINFIL